MHHSGIIRISVTAGLVLFSSPLRVCAQGPLEPPGPPAAAMKTLQEVEPRTPISRLPYAITNSGAYYVITNLNGGAGTGISIEASDVDLDLNGFTVYGGIGVGILAPIPVNNLRVRNGVVRGWPTGGMNVQVAGNGQYANLFLYGNGSGGAGDGLLAGANASIVNCTALANGGNGLRPGNGNSVNGCVARGNGASGISALSGSVLIGCTAESNTNNGFLASACVLRDCEAGSNGGDGINADQRSTIRSCSARSNTGDGIQVANDCEVEGNLCTANGLATGDGAGIHATGNDNRITGNHLTDCDRGLDLDGADNYVAENTVRGNTNNYDIAASNQLNILVCQIPQVIPWPAHVKLAGSLTGVAGFGGIAINADDVTVDLNGFDLIGVPGSFSGISVGSDRHNITIRNGTVRDWGQTGVAADDAMNSSLVEVKAFTNGWEAGFQFGLQIGEGSLIARCEAAFNTTRGISAGPNSTVIESLAYKNQEVGIHGGGGNTIRDCTASQNGQDGIFLNAGGTISGCTVKNNGNDGISANLACTIDSCTANSNTNRGISAGSGSVINNCAARDNNAVGINGDDGVAIHNSSSFANTNGIVAGDGSTIHNCSSGFNSGIGINAGDGATISDCSAFFNGLDGISVGNDSTVQGNTCDQNGFAGSGAGIRTTGTGNRIDGNQVLANDEGIRILSAQNLVVRNSARNNSSGASNYVFAAGTRQGGIVSVSAAFTNDNPWVNFEF